MKILMTHYEYFPTAGGVTSHLLDLCGELVRQGHEVHALVGSLDGQPGYKRVDGTHVHRNRLMNPEWLRDQKAAKHIAADEEDEDFIRAIQEMYGDFIAEHGIDVVHGHNLHHLVPEHAMALTRLWEQGTPSVLTVHEAWNDFIGEDLLRRARWDTVITTCKHVTDGIRAQAPRLEDIRVIHPGIDVRRFSPTNSHPRWADRLALRGRPVVIHPARMLPWKGVLYSVRAMRKVVERLPDALLIVTDTDDIAAWIGELNGYKEEILQTVRALGLGKSVVTQPFPYLEMPWVYNFCDVVIYPSVGEEPFSLVPVEAMACAKPAVVTPSGGMVESVVSEETGFFAKKRDPYELADRILLLLNDKDLAARMGRAGRQRAVEVFSRERMARDTMEVYQTAVARHRSGVPA